MKKSFILSGIAYVLASCAKDEMPLVPVEPEEPDWNHPENYVISDPVLVETNYFFRMNWGGDGNFDNTLYYYGDNWVVTDSQNRQCNFTNQRRMIYNIH